MNRFAFEFFLVLVTSFVLSGLTMIFMPKKASPRMILLGSSEEISVHIQEKNHLFYVSKKDSIESEYKDILKRLQYKLLGPKGEEIPLESVADFFYRRNFDSEIVQGGSIFCASPRLSYPFDAKLVSNISKLPSLMWMQTSGSVLPSVIIGSLAIILNLILSFVLVHFYLIRWFKRRFVNHSITK